MHGFVDLVPPIPFPVYTNSLFICADFESFIHGEPGDGQRAGDQHQLRRKHEGGGFRGGGGREMAQSRICRHSCQFDVNVFRNAIGARESLKGRQLMLR